MLTVETHVNKPQVNLVETFLHLNYWDHEPLRHVLNISWASKVCMSQVKFCFCNVTMVVSLHQISKYLNFVCVCIYMRNSLYNIWSLFISKGYCTLQVYFQTNLPHKIYLSHISKKSHNISYPISIRVTKNNFKRTINCIQKLHQYEKYKIDGFYSS